MIQKVFRQLNNFWRAVFPVKSLPVHHLWLHFHARPLEKEFQEYFYEKYLPAIRLAMMVSVLVFLSFQLLDYMVTGEFLNEALPVRFFIYLPFSVLVIYLTFLIAFREIWNYLVWGWVLTTALAGLICIYLEPVEVQPISSLGLMIFLLISFYLFGLRPFQALMTLVVVSSLSLYFLLQWVVVPSVYLFPILIFVLIIAIAGFFIAWRIDFVARHEFFLEKQTQALLQEKDLLYTETLLADQAFMRLNPSYRDNRRMLIADLLLGKVGTVLRNDINQVLGYCLLAEEDCVGKERVKSYFAALRQRILDFINTTENITNLATLSYNLIKPKTEPVVLSTTLFEIHEKLLVAENKKPLPNKITIDIEDNLKGKVINIDIYILTRLITNLTKVLCLNFPQGQIAYGLKYKAERRPKKIAIEIKCLGASPKEDFTRLLDSLIRKSLLMKPLVGFEKEELNLVTALELAPLINAEIDYYVGTDSTLSIELYLAAES
ncbi:MAG: hypothetical protein HPY80_11400 [Bacteroidales bacterium]|jgi:hypothetical protein|nr:hypothetical protein [Bacteroidales bacterium]NPV37259.1 hypothetical protein [Bacteroidales bacterium]